MELKWDMPALCILWLSFAFSTGVCDSQFHIRGKFPFSSALRVPREANASAASPGKLGDARSSCKSALTNSSRRRLSKRSIPPSQLPSVMTSNMTGYVTSGHCDVQMAFICAKDASFVVAVPKDHVTLLSFPVFHLKWAWYSGGEGFVQLTRWPARGRNSTIWMYKSSRTIVPELYHSTVRLRLYIPRGDTLENGFKMIFSLHSVSQTPPKLSEGVFNCSVPFYHTFKEHFDCNLVKDCPSGRDEGTHCPLTTSECQGQGHIASGSKCYIHLRKEVPVKWTMARQECEERGGHLATIKTPEDWKAFLYLLEAAHMLDPVYIGLRSFEPSMPSIYKHSYIWVDNTVNYRYGTLARTYSSFYMQVCFMYGLELAGTSQLFRNYFFCVPCDSYLLKDFVCEIKTTRNSTTNSSSFSWPELKVEDDVLQGAKQFLIKCPAGHASHSFLSCDPNSQCGAEQYVSQCAFPDAEDSQPAIAMFDCDHSSETVPFTLVCDFRQDCADGSDETFCAHSEHCLGFLCTNGQCLSKTKQCDVARDCWDGSDELCIQYHNLYGLTYYDPPPVLVSFNSEGVMKQTSLRGCASCPQTHFCCPEGYCLPLYCRCNGIGDCEGQEDEADCEDFQCHGLYRCRSSRVCVHADHLCDGWPQCPQHDDEWLCGALCPQGCQCQGLAFLCPQPFSLAAFPHLRYLDAADSGLRVEDFTGHAYLVWLSLARCFVRGVSNITLPNLKFLYLRHNRLSSLNMSIFTTFENLQILDLSNNPLVSVVGGLTGRRHRNLVSVDLSGNQMTVFNTAVLSNFPKVSVLNISHSTLTALSGTGYRSIPHLVDLDMRGSQISEYPSDVFKRLHRLQTIRADNYKLCCKELLPADFDPDRCFAPVDEISSCEDLLRSDTYRTFLWLFSVLSLAGNMGCVVTRLFLLKSRSLTAFSIFVTNLSFADLLMGTYLALVGTVDHMYRGKYFWFEKHWKLSTACQIAGFLSLLSSETSAFTICLITLDRFLVLSSPFSDLRFNRRTAVLVCLVVWGLGLILAAVPLLPATTDWRFYSQTGICIPLPITRRTFKGWNYAFAVIIVVNFVLFLLIATGQAMIYWTIRTTSMAQWSTRKTKDLTIARRLVTVVVSDFLCWFPIGLLGILSASGTPIPGEVNVGMAIFVLPLNAALNPFLYTFKALTERWKKMEEKQLLRQLEARSPAL